MAALVGAACAGQSGWSENLSLAEKEDKLTKLIADKRHFPLGKIFSKEEVCSQMKEGKLNRKFITTAMQLTNGRFRRRYLAMFRPIISGWKIEHEPVKALLGKIATNSDDTSSWTEILCLLLKNWSVGEEIEKESTYDEVLVELVKNPELADAFYERYMKQANSSKLIAMIKRNAGFRRLLIDDKNAAANFYFSMMTYCSELFKEMRDGGVDLEFVDQLVHAFIADRYWLCLNNLDRVRGMVSGRDDALAELWRDHLKDEGIVGKDDDPLSASIEAARENWLTRPPEDLVRRLLKFDQMHFLKRLLRRLSKEASLFEELSKTGKFDVEIREGFSRDINKKNCTYIADWLDNVSRVDVLLEDEELGSVIRESLKTLIRDCRANSLKELLDRLWMAREVFSEFSRSGELDGGMVECLDELAIYFGHGSTEEREYLMEILLEAKKGSLVVEWLEELNKRQRPHALDLLLRVFPASSGLLKELLSNGVWREAAAVCNEQPGKYGITDKLCALLDTLLEPSGGHSEMELEETLE